MNRSVFKLTFFIVAVALAACGGKSNDVRDAARESLGGNTPAATPAPVMTDPNTMAATAPGGVQHYTCPNNCEGSGGSAAGTCPVCGTAYVHNQAFHAQQQTQQQGTTTTSADGQTIQKVTFPGSTTPAAPGSTTAKPPDPPQNAAGVWHYTCPKGCAGGAGAAIACATCGTALAHNAAYHQ